MKIERYLHVGKPLGAQMKPLGVDLKASGKKSIAEIARFVGFKSNCGPIVYCPNNAKLFGYKSPDLDKVTDPNFLRKKKLFIPYTRDDIKKLRRKSDDRIKQMRDDRKKLASKAKMSTGQMKDLFFAYDFLAAVAELGVGVSAAASRAAGVSEAKIAKEMTAARNLALEKSFAPLKKYAVDKGDKYLKKNAGKAINWINQITKLTHRHGSSLLSPSYYASIYAAFATGDWDVWVVGEDKLFKKVQKQLLQHADSRIRKAETANANMTKVLAASFYSSPFVVGN